MTTRARRLALLLTGAVGVACGGVAWVDVGPRGAMAAIVAVGLVAAFFIAGAVPLALAGGGTTGTGLALGVLLLTYSLRLALVLLLLVMLDRAAFVDVHWLGITIIASAAVWSAAHVAVVVRTPGGR